MEWYLSTWILMLSVVRVLVAETPIVYGILPTSPESFSDGAVVVKPNNPTELQLFGTNLLTFSYIAFATTAGEPHASCEQITVTPHFILTHKSDFVCTSVVNLRELGKGESAFYLCLKNEATSNWSYAGNSSAITVKTTTSLLPIWLQSIIITCLFFLSGLFSGLNLGLMSLNKTDLKIIESAGSRSEKKYARAIRPIRERGNLLLCTILLGNVLVNNSLTILMDDLTGSGMIAIICSTIGITLFGEIMPQAICSRHGLAVGARTLWLTKFFIIITFPIAFPISFILDKILGEEMGQVYSRDKLDVLIREQVTAGTVITDEQKIITGALLITTKTVADVMTPINDAYMLSYTDVLNFHILNEIYSQGFSRIPVYDKDRQNIRSLINVRDLAFINPDDNVPVSTVCDFYNRPIIVVMDSHSLETMLKEFRTGGTHMAFVERLVIEGEGDPDREIVGLLTLEDVIEEIIQYEIFDETDVLTRQVRKRDFAMFTEHSHHNRSRLSPQLKIAALRHLSSNVPAFHESLVSYSVLQSFLNFDIVFELIHNPLDEESNVLFSPQKWANHAILLLQGRALVQIGIEKLQFEAGPFVMFGEAVLNQVNAAFPDPNDLSVDAKLPTATRLLPDYSVKAVTNIQYIHISAKHYLLARRLSLRQRASSSFALRTGASFSEVNTSSAMRQSPRSSYQHDLFQSAIEQLEHKDNTVVNQQQSQSPPGSIRDPPPPNQSKSATFQPDLNLTRRSEKRANLQQTSLDQTESPPPTAAEDLTVVIRDPLSSSSSSRNPDVFCDNKPDSNNNSSNGGNSRASISIEQQQKQHESRI